MTAADGRRAASASSAQLLDNPVWSSLSGLDLPFSEGNASARRYRRGVSPFAAVSDFADPKAWRALRDLVDPAETVAIAGSIDHISRDWEVLGQGDGVQLIATDALDSRPDAEAQVLGVADVDAMLELVSTTKPGPFLANTYLLGTYLGIRRDGKLVAMAGERLHLDGWTEISAVCTDAEHRGQGLAARLVRAVAHGIRDRGNTPFLHAAASNINAIRLYESLGFELRRSITFAGIRPSDATSH